MEHEGHRQRMRQRFLEQGLEGFAPHEALELLLFYAIPQRNVNPLAHELINHFGTLDAVLHASPSQLMQVKGIGETTAVLISMQSQLMRQAERTKKDRRCRLDTRRQAVEYVQALLANERYEAFYVICLNGQMETIYNALIARGSLCDVPAYPRLVAEAALTHKAHSVILCHNHPGGSAIPSQSDLDTTKILARCLKDMEVVLVDHFIVAEDETFSMVRNDLIEQRCEPMEIQTKIASSVGETRLRHKLCLEGKQKMEEK